jgi:hypothetical protein
LPTLSPRIIYKEGEKKMKIGLLGTWDNEAVEALNAFIKTINPNADITLFQNDCFVKTAIKKIITENQLTILCIDKILEIISNDKRSLRSISKPCKIFYVEDLAYVPIIVKKRSANQ